MSEQTERNKEIVRRYQDAYNQGDLVGLAATGNPVEFGGTSIFEIEDDRIVRHTAFNDILPTLHQCGAEVPPEWLAFTHHSVDRTI